MAPPPPMQQPALPPMREVTEDTPPDMLTGAMDLRVLLPDGHSVKMSVDRSTPMMDLLVHVTTANKMSPGSHVIQAVGEKGNILPYKPSTPIGALDTWTIQIVSKTKASAVGHKKAPLKPSNQPFEQTFRLQVNLPRNQLFVTRVSPRTPLSELLKHVCSEKGLDPDKYDLRNPMNPDEVLRLTCNLLDYKLQEITVALRGSTVPHSHHSHQRVHTTSAGDIISLQHQQLTESGDKRRKSSGSTTANSGGVFGFIFKRGSRSSVCEGSISSDSLGGQSISPARSDESLGPVRSASPPLPPQAPLRSVQDQLRNQINNQMSRRQENSCRPVLSENSECMDERQPPPPPVRHRKRRAPKPPVQNPESGSKKSSEFITPVPPSVPAPIPVARRKSTPAEDDEYDEEEVGNVVGGNKAKLDGGGSSGTLISHSRNSSDSSGYHEASVLSESPESGLGGSGAPDTLPRRKQQQQLQQQRAAAAAASSSQVPAFSRSMGNLACAAPPVHSSTTSSKTLISSSSLSVSTSSLPSQKKKKAPAPPPPPPGKQQANDVVTNKVTSKMTLSTSSLDRNAINGREEESASLKRDFVHKPKVISKVTSEAPKPSLLAKPIQSEPTSLDLPVLKADKRNDVSLEKPALLPIIGSASKPACGNKLDPAVASKPKVNLSAVPQRNGQGSQDAIPIPKPRSRQPKKCVAPSPAPRPQPPVSTCKESELENPPKEFKVEEIVAIDPISDSSSRKEEVEYASSLDVAKSLTKDSVDLDTGEEVDDLVGEDLDLSLFDGSKSCGSSEDSVAEEEEEAFDDDVIRKILMKHKQRSFADVFNSRANELVVEDVEPEAILNSQESNVEGFCLEMNKRGSLSEKMAPINPIGYLESAEFMPLKDGMINGKIRQVESAINFSNLGGEVLGELNDFGRFSSNSLCSEVDMPFTNVGRAVTMNRWENMEYLNQSSSPAKEDCSPLEEDDSAHWVVGSESDNELQDAIESTADNMADFVDETDDAVQQIEDLIHKDIKSLDRMKTEEKLVDYDSEKANESGIPTTFLPSPPPSLEYMGPDECKPFAGRCEEVMMEWEYRLPAPPTGFEDEEEGREEERETWVAESESTFSSATSHSRKAWTGRDVENQPINHLPNFRMSTYKLSSDDGWENPREVKGNQRKSVEDTSGNSKGRTFVMLNSDSNEKTEKEEANKSSLETWESVSSKSTLSNANSSNMYNPYINSSLKDAVDSEVNRPKKNASYVVRVSSFGGKSSMNLKRSLSSTSSLVSRLSNNDGRDLLEKLDTCGRQSSKAQSSPRKGLEVHSLSNASRTVSLHDLAVNSIEEESRVAVSLTNGYHKENTTPKIVSSKWKKPQGVGGDQLGKYSSSDSHNLRKTSSELSINQGHFNGWKGAEEEDEQVVILQQQFLQWHEQMLENKNSLDGNVSLKSLQVLRGVLPQLKKSLNSDLVDVVQTSNSDGMQKKVDGRGIDQNETRKNNEEVVDSLSASIESHDPSSNSGASSLERTSQEVDAPKRYSYAGPPAINFGTWSERPKSEVSLKRDSDYRIGVGQAPRTRESQNPNTAIHPGKSAQPIQSNEIGPPCPPPKPSNRVVVNIVSATKQETVSRLPIVRSVELKKTASSTNTSQIRPLSGSFPNDLREELTGALASLVDANRNGVAKAADEFNERRKRQQVPCSFAVPPPPPDVMARHSLNSQGTNLRRMGSAAGLECGSRVNSFGGHEKRHTIAPVVKGFRLNSIAATASQTPTPPPPPPAIVCGVALKKKAESSLIPKLLENPRDQLLMAIKEFGGRENLKKTAINYK